jgi:NADH:ubiquinone oxidoreductase subunit E
MPATVSLALRNPKARPSGCSTRRDEQPYGRYGALLSGRRFRVTESNEAIYHRGVITHEQLDDLAADLGTSLANLYAALALTDEVAMAPETEVSFRACAGGCQQWGAMDALDALVTARQQRADAGKRLFDIIPVPCLDKCEAAAVLELHSPDGAAVIQEVTSEKVAEAIRDALD